ncbi:hypothetical protein GCM10023088_52050 [Actinomadura verrucosospora]|uniref:hypothetical protein n=1 Tax=Actinomadura verrucosospora TaxID=46165 RepID=UPI0031E8084C
MHPEVPPTGPKGLDTPIIVITLAGTMVGVLSFLADHSIPRAFLAAATATGSIADLLMQFLPRRHLVRGPGDQDDDQGGDHTERHT